MSDPFSELEEPYDVFKRQVLGLSEAVDPDTFDRSLEYENVRDFGLNVDLVDDLEDLDLEDAEDLVDIDAELDEIDEDDLEEQLEDLDEEVEAEELEEEIFFGRRAMANRVRCELSRRKDSFGAAMEMGYAKALHDLGVPQEAYGGLIKDAGLGIGQAVRSASKGFFGPGGLSAMATKAGTSLRQDVDPSLAIEADASTLPPVYVADEEGYDEDEAFDEEEAVWLDAEDTFGAVARYGFVGSQPRQRAREAAHLSVKNAKQELRQTGRGRARPFVEDPGAAPILYEDGAIYDAVYGALCPVPCPSCTRTIEKRAAGGSSEDCFTCEQYGAVLVPASDVDDYMSSPSYGFIPLLIKGAAMAAKPIAKGKLFPKAGKKVQVWFKNIFRKKEEEPEEDSIEFADEFEDDYEEEYGRVVRALVPQSWENR